MPGNQDNLAVLGVKAFQHIVTSRTQTAFAAIAHDSATNFLGGGEPYFRRDSGISIFGAQ